MRTATIELMPGTELTIPVEEYNETLAWCRAYRKIAERQRDEQHVFRMVDVGASCGVFAAFAAIRWPYAYLDCYEASDARRRIALLNVQPGTRVLAELPQVLPACDGLRVAGNVRLHELDGESLGKLRVCLWEFASDVVFDSVSSLMRAIGMSLVHVATVDSGPPARGLMLWIRRKDKHP